MKFDDFFDSVKRLAEEVTPEMLSRRSELQADVGMDDYGRRIGGWIQALKDCQNPKENVLETATRCSLSDEGAQPRARRILGARCLCRDPPGKRQGCGMKQTDIATTLDLIAKSRLAPIPGSEDALRVAAIILRRRAEQSGDQVCTDCGCCDWDACWQTEHGNCSWAEPGLCTGCAQKRQPVDACPLPTSHTANDSRPNANNI